MSAICHFLVRKELSMHSIYGWGLTVGGVSFIDARLCITVRLVDASGALRVTWPCFAGTAERGLTALLRRICRLLTRLGDPVVWDCATRHVDTRDLLPFQGTLRCIGVEGSHYRVDLAYTMEFILPETVPSMPTRRYSTHAASP